MAGLVIPNGVRLICSCVYRGQRNSRDMSGAAITVYGEKLNVSFKTCPALLLLLVRMLVSTFMRKNPLGLYREFNPKGWNSNNTEKCIQNVVQWTSLRY